VKLASGIALTRWQIEACWHDAMIPEAAGARQVS
jgi:hypothetical protein